MVIFNFFFSSRRRHTRYWRDWSSDVCSSDLLLAISLSTTDAVGHLYGPESREIHDQVVRLDRYLGWFLGQLLVRYGAGGVTRSEERRVGKECRSRCLTSLYNNNKITRCEER